MDSKYLVKLRNDLSNEIKTTFGITREHTDEKSSEIKNEPVEIYAKINNIEFRKDKDIIDENGKKKYGKYRFHISGDLLTDTLIKFDNEYFDDNAIFNQYKSSLRPVFFGFETSISIDTMIDHKNTVTKLLYYELKEAGIELPEEKSKFNKNNGYNRKEIIKEIENFFYDDQTNVDSEFFLNISEGSLYKSIFKIRLAKDPYHRSTVYFSASPFIFSNKRIIFNNNTPVEYIPNKLSYVSSLDQTDITSKLKAFVPKELREYNVGQGNFSELIDINNKKIVYDVGMTYLDDHNNFCGACTELKKLDAECYFISHFDLDHILGSVYLADNQFEKDKLWIIPEPQIHQYSNSALRLIQYLNKTTCLRMITDSNKNNDFVFNSNITIYKGTAKTNSVKKSSTYINGSGIMISAKGNNKVALLTGDCLYKYWSNKICNNQKYDYLIVPHHGCEVDCNSINIQGNNNAIAVVPVGVQQNNYRHPNKDHMDKLFDKKINFNNIYLTADLTKKHSKNNIDIDMNNYPTKSKIVYIPLQL